MGASSWSPNSTDLHLNIYLLCKYRNLKDTAGQSARKRPERLVTLIRFFVLWAPQLFSQFYKIIYTMNIHWQLIIYWLLILSTMHIYWQQLIIFGRLTLYWQLCDGTGSLIRAVICHQSQTLSRIEIWTPLLNDKYIEQIG